MVNQAAHLLATPSRVTLSEIWYQSLTEEFSNGTCEEHTPGIHTRLSMPR